MMDEMSGKLPNSARNILHACNYDVSAPCKLATVEESFSAVTILESLHSADCLLHVTLFACVHDVSYSCLTADAVAMSYITTETVKLSTPTFQQESFSFSLWLELLLQLQSLY